jgi:hypothetical protein
MGWPSPEIISAYAELFTAFQWPLVALILGFLFRHQIRNLLVRMKSGEVFGQKFEISDDVDALRTQVAESGAEDFTPSSHISEEIASTPDREIAAIEREVLEVAGFSPRAAVMLVGAEIEQYLRWLVENAGYHLRPNASVHEIANRMESEGAIPASTRRSLDEFWRLRNRIVHEFAGNSTENLAVTDIGLSLLRQLRSR